MRSPDYFDGAQLDEMPAQTDRYAHCLPEGDPEPESKDDGCWLCGADMSTYARDVKVCDYCWAVSQGLR